MSVSRDGEYLTHIEASQATAFIEARDKGKPFFLYVPFTAPHSPMQAPAKTIEKYKHLSRQGYQRVYAAMVDEMDMAIGSILGTGGCALAKPLGCWDCFRSNNVVP